MPERVIVKYRERYRDTFHKRSSETSSAEREYQYRSAKMMVAVYWAMKYIATTVALRTER
jgi:hypothetical protein